MAHRHMSILEETGYVVLDSYGDPIDPAEWKFITEKLLK